MIIFTKKPPLRRWFFCAPTLGFQPLFEPLIDVSKIDNYGMISWLLLWIAFSQAVKGE